MREYEYTAVISRFEPAHKAHQALFQIALDKGEKVIILVGSHNRASDPRNPWSSEERIEMISSAIEPKDLDRVQFLPIRDFDYNPNTWLTEVQYRVGEITEHSESVALVGHKSDFTSSYLDAFPQWKFLDYKQTHQLHATKIREHYFQHDNVYKNFLHPNVVKYLEAFKRSEKFRILKDHFDDLAEYYEKWRGAPFKPTFHTVDAVVLKSGHVLVVRRKGRQGYGLLAWPGGFLGQEETCLEASLRELDEETEIAERMSTLRSSIVDQRTFDAPLRSLRGRTITNAFFIDLGRGPLPKVKGKDDAMHATWLSLSEFNARESEFFEDHWHIGHYFVSGASR